MKLSEHFQLQEFACHDGTPYPINEIDKEDLKGRTWGVSRLLPLVDTLEVIREIAGNKKLIIASAYRTLRYDQNLYIKSLKNPQKELTKAPPATSQHPKGRAVDIQHSVLNPRALYDAILAAYLQGRLPSLGGVGLYPTFVHVDVRPRPNNGHVALWGGPRPQALV